MTSSTNSLTRQALPLSVDVAIVGAGIGGLTAGAYLAQAGLKVAIFDSHSIAGGCCTQFGRGPKTERYHFDVGLHYIGDCGPQGIIPNILKGVGVEAEYEPMEQDGFDTLIFPDFEFKIPANIELYRERLVKLFPKERRGIDRYIRLLKEVTEIGSFADKHKGGQLSFLWYILRHGRLGARYKNATIGDFFGTSIRDQRLRAVLLGQSGDYGLPPSQVSAVLHMGLSAHYFKGAYYPKGGGQIFSDRLVEKIKTNGGSIYLKSPVEEIIVENGKACGVYVNPKHGEAGRVNAKLVISNADLIQSVQRLIKPEHVPASLQKQASKWKMACGIFMTYLGVQGDMKKRGMRNSNYWKFSDYDTEGLYRDQVALHQAVKPRACYITSASMKDPSSNQHAPEGVMNVEVMTVVPGQAELWGTSYEGATTWEYKKTESYKEMKAKYEEAMVSEIESLFPGTKENIVFQESASPLTHTRYTRATDGTGYGLACTPEQFLERRPSYRSPIAGLYFCGASTRSGHGVVGAMLSGVHTSRKVAKELGKTIERPF